jgi:hypothetical protein
VIADAIEYFFDVMDEVRKPPKAGGCAGTFQGVHRAEDAVHQIRVERVLFEGEQRITQIGKQIGGLRKECGLQLLDNFSIHHLDHFFLLE